MNEGSIKSRIESWPRHIVLGGDDPTGGLEQNALELLGLCGFIREKGIKTYVEVGIAAGLLLKFMRDEMGMVVYGITLEFRDTHGGLPVSYGMSDDPLILGRAPEADLYFIDADHSYESVKADYANYKGKCKYMAFHDMLGLRSCDGVAALWSEIKGRHESWEFVDENLGHASGIGVIKV